MNLNTNTAEDRFFTMLDCARVYCDYKNSEDGEELSDEDADKVLAYAIYLNKLSEQTYQQTGEGL